MAGWTRHLLPTFLLLAARAGAMPPEVPVTDLLFVPESLPEQGEVPARPLVSLSTARRIVDAQGLADGGREAVEKDLAAYLARIGDAEATYGSWPDLLREDLLEAGLRYQALAQHDEALRMMERARTVNRASTGLESLDQVAIMEAMARSRRALHEFREADALMDAALLLRRNAYGAHSLQLVQPLLNLGDWNRDAFLERARIQRERGEVPMAFDAAYAPHDAGNAPLRKLLQARENYSAALQILIDAGEYSHPDLLALEHRLLGSHFLYAHRERIVREPDFYQNAAAPHASRHLIDPALASYDLGLESFKRIRAYFENAGPLPPAQAAAALLEEADWELLFDRGVAAAGKYDEVYRRFAASPAGQGLEELLYPAVPTVLPTWLPAPHSRAQLGIAPDAPVAFFGYVDVSFDLTRFGRARGIRVLGVGGEITRDMEVRLKQYLRNMQFRPRYTDGGSRAGPVKLRYYVGI